MSEFLQLLKQRKLVQWTLAYGAAAFALLQGIDIVAQRFAWPDSIERLLIVAACVGFFPVLVLAWYHGERGAQRMTGTELVILALLLTLGGGFLWRFTGGSRAARVATAVPITAIPDKAIALAPDLATGTTSEQAMGTFGGALRLRADESRGDQLLRSVTKQLAKKASA